MKEADPEMVFQLRNLTGDCSLTELALAGYAKGRIGLAGVADIFGLDKHVPWGAQIHSFLVGDYQVITDRDVTGRYDIHAYDREKRGGLGKWADELLRIVATKGRAQPATKVLPWAK